ncbi:MAG TPA: GWxTD domain-containing protein [Candidatus Cloacimonadota bacterium]|nr:GWxTD domain-containing protein [Candidatus Cloacimonadota bacterium]
MNKRILIVLLFFTAIYCWSATLPVSVDISRFLDEKRHTRFEINYQVKYSNLSFENVNKNYFASLNVKVEVLKADSIVTQKSFTNRIGVSNLNDAGSDQKSFMDKISLVLNGSSYKIRLTFTDSKTLDSKTWTHELIGLPPSSMISDIELSKAIVPADTTRFLEKFKRDGRVYVDEPSHVFYPVKQDSLYLFAQLYSLSTSDDKTYPYEIEFRVIKDKTVVRKWNIKDVASLSTANITRGISIKNLEYGLYDLDIEVNSGLRNSKASTFFVLGEIKEELISILPNIDDEIRLIRYYAPSSKVGNVETLTQDAKKRMVNQLWYSIAAENGMDVESWTDQVKQRISYANRTFSHFKPGWETDMGRIYLRYGAPDDIRKEVTSDDTKFVQKDFQIWKYSTSDRIYVFIDIQMNGNFKMIYAKNDDQERSQPNWQSYLGSDYDEDELEKDSYNKLKE